MGDIYSWVLSPEIRDYLRTARPLTTVEKVEIIDSGYHSVEEKYAALTSLLRGTGNEDDKALLTDTLRLYDWAFEELHSQRPGQVFLFQKAIMSNGPYNVQEVFRTYEELTEYLKEDEMSYQNYSLEYPYAVSFEGFVDKWAEIDGKMQCVLGLTIFWWMEKSSYRTVSSAIWMMTLRTDVKATKRHGFAGQAIQPFLCRSIQEIWFR